MAEPSFVRIQTTPLSSVDVTDRFFAQSPAWLEFPEMTASVCRVGVLNPLVLQETLADRFRVVSGFRRMMAAREAGLTCVPSLVAAGISDRALFLQTLWENLGTRRFQTVEKALVLQKLKQVFDFDDAHLVSEFLPALELPPTRARLMQCLKLASLPESIQELIPELQPEIAIGVSRWNPTEQIVFLDLFRRYRLGRNKQVRLFELLDELRAGSSEAAGHAGLPEIWRSSGAEEQDKDTRLNPGERFERILEALWRTRYPVLYAQEQKARHLRSTLRIPKGVQLSLPRFFEGDTLSVQLSFRSRTELEDQSVRLLEIARSETLSALLELL